MPVGRTALNLSSQYKKSKLQHRCSRVFLFVSGEQTRSITWPGQRTASATASCTLTCFLTARLVARKKSKGGDVGCRVLHPVVSMVRSHYRKQMRPDRQHARKGRTLRPTHGNIIAGSEAASPLAPSCMPHTLHITTH